MDEGTEDSFKILAVDGGGIRGVVPAHIIQLMHSKFGIIPAKHFDLIAGTSTGAIIAAALACEIEPPKIVALYREHGARIFSKKKSWWPSFAKQAVHSLYDQDELSKLLLEVFGDRKLGDLKKPLLLPSTNVGEGCVHVFKSGYSTKFIRDRDVLIREAVLASCAAPTYFDPKKVDVYLLADGGLWANNPALTASIEAIHRMQIKVERLRVLSVGTGHSKIYYNRPNERWGLVTGWQHKNFINFILSLQSQVAHNHLKLMLPESQWLRLDFESDKELALDDVSAVDWLISKSDRLFMDESDKLKSFLEVRCKEMYAK